MSNKKELSLYIHIPFCKKKCNYCDFLSFECQDPSSYIRALIKEIEDVSLDINNYIIKTIFIGGGTPSLIDGSYIEMIMAKIFDSMDVCENAEITIECNPGTITKEKALAYLRARINRISLGLQSTDDRVLESLGRIHNYKTFLENYNLLRALGFDNINVDLMFSLPDQSNKMWLETLNRVIALEPEHISIYSLIIEAHTPFMKMYDNDELALPTEEVDRGMYWEANRLLESYGYHQYEISNYAKRDRESKHNRVYWELKEYIGIGLGAASYFKGYRTSNTRDMNRYIEVNGKREDLVVESTPLSRENKKEEFMFLGLRLIEGIKIDDFGKLFNESIESTYGNVLKKLIKDNLIERIDDRIRLTNKGIDVSNYVFSEFLLNTT